MTDNFTTPEWMNESMTGMVRNPKPFSLGNMKTVSGEVLRWEVARLSRVLTIRISEKLFETQTFKAVSRITPSRWTESFFENRVRDEIYPVLIQLCVARWRYKQGCEEWLDLGETEVPTTAPMLFLKELWEDENVQLVIGSGDLDQGSRSLFREGIVKFKDFLLEKIGQLQGERESPVGPGLRVPTIAVRHAEGIDPKRRSDVVWLPGSGISPQQILLFTDSVVTDELVEACERLGIRCTAWRPYRKGQDETRNYILTEKFKAVSPPQNIVENWVYSAAVDLFAQMGYWNDFHSKHNVRVLFDPSEGTDLNIAQANAFDVNRQGITVGKQRSELYGPPGVLYGHYTRDVFFLWNARMAEHLKPDRNRIRYGVVTGYTNDNLFESHSERTGLELRRRVKSAGARFIVSLFDNLPQANSHFSNLAVAQFYRVFLRWVIEDSSLGLLIKSKKAEVFHRIPEILPLLAEAEKTGRCIRLEDEAGRLPAEVSTGSDIAVGIGISTAVIEAVLAGGRGIHYDVSKLRTHEYYKWGVNQIIFDDFDNLIDSLRRFKEHSSEVGDLGDWTRFLDQLDPFRDGRAAERMGSYLRWCMEGFDNGLDRLDVMRTANKKYALHWGADKVIEMDS